MKLLSRIEIPGKPGKAIELLQGDLTEPDSQHPFDLLVLSAFPDDYVPTPSSLIGALHAKGLSVSQLHRELCQRNFLLRIMFAVGRVGLFSKKPRVRCQWI